MTLPPPLPPPARPLFIWIISGYYLFSFIMAGFSLWLTYSGLIPLPEPQRSYIHSLTSVDYLFALSVLVFKLGGAVALFFRRRAAVYAFALGFLASIADISYQIVAKNYLHVLGPLPLIGVAFGWATSVAVIGYTVYLTQKGYLR